MSPEWNPQAAIAWGNFVLVAKSMYQPGIPNPAQPANFPDGWRLVRNITMEPVVAWIREREFIGFVAESLAEPGKVAVILHGSETVLDFIDDFEFARTSFPLIPHSGETEYGFTQLYQSLSFVDPHSGAVEGLDEHLRAQSAVKWMTVAGHSLGGALGILHAAVLASRQIPVSAYIFASPMVGDHAFVQSFQALVPARFVICNQPDIVPELPGEPLGYAHPEPVVVINSLQHEEIKHSLGCYHALNTYLYTLGDTGRNLETCRSDDPD